MQRNQLAAQALLWLVLISANIAFATERQEKPIIVTATRTPQTVDSALASVTVISRQDIERQQARSVQMYYAAFPGSAFRTMAAWEKRRLYSCAAPNPITYWC